MMYITNRCSLCRYALAACQTRTEVSMILHPLALPRIMNTASLCVFCIFYRRNQMHLPIPCNVLEISQLFGGGGANTIGE